MKIEIEQAYNGYIKELCSEHLRLELQDQMKKSLDNPKNNTCD